MKIKRAIIDTETNEVTFITEEIPDEETPPPQEE